MLWIFLWINRVCGGEDGTDGAITVHMQHSVRKLSTYSLEPFSSASLMPTVEALENADLTVRAPPTLTGRREGR
jgi:hypothetical protein